MGAWRRHAKGDYRRDVKGGFLWVERQGRRWWVATYEKPKKTITIGSSYTAREGRELADFWHETRRTLAKRMASTLYHLMGWDKDGKKDTTQGDNGSNGDGDTGAAGASGLDQHNANNMHHDHSMSVPDRACCDGCSQEPRGSEKEDEELGA